MNIRLIIAIGLLALAGCKANLQLEGNGAGSLTGINHDFNCSNTSLENCQVDIAFGDTLTIVAQAGPNSEFVAWKGDCEGTEGPECSINVIGNHKVMAVFERPNFEEAPIDCGTDDANSLCLEPTQTPEYYIDQSIKYFLTMESSVSPLVIPRYSSKVVRWEWPPWLLLTGYERFNLIWTDIVLKLNPTAYAVLNCQAFDVQPFGRCHVVFDYSGELCPIYEEFTFNDQGEITFIEAWTDMPGWIPMEPEDYWAEGNITKRLSTRVPGLGNETGLVDWDSEGMQAAAAKDADVAELVKRANDPYRTWFQQLLEHTQELAEGCDPDHIGFELD
ncbi:MAG: hypothetical protein MI867_23500 [Pseudomonadales bacterium]|nr:hypothetical protein [Pseudomonadales bacterium]